MIVQDASGFHIFHRGQYLKGPFKARELAEAADKGPELTEIKRRREAEDEDPTTSVAS